MIYVWAAMAAIGFLSLVGATAGSEHMGPRWLFPVSSVTLAAIAALAIFLGTVATA